MPKSLMLSLCVGTRTMVGKDCKRAHSYRLLCLTHSRSFKTPPENTIKGGTRHCVEPNWFNASLKPHSYFVLTLHIIYHLSSSSSLSLSLFLVTSIYIYIYRSLLFSLPLSGVLRSSVLLVLIVLPFSSTNPLSV